MSRRCRGDVAEMSRSRFGMHFLHSQAIFSDYEFFCVKSLDQPSFLRFFELLIKQREMPGFRVILK